MKESERQLLHNPFDLLDKDFLNIEEEFDTNKFSSIHQKLSEKPKKNAPLTYISNTYSSV